MNNKVIFAAARNGKTYDICKQAIELSQNTIKDILIISYTNEGKNSIEKEYKKQNCGIIDKNVVMKTWYSFFLSDFIKPYQCKLNLTYKNYKQEINCNIPPNLINSIAFYTNEKPNRVFNGGHVQYYLNSRYDLFKDNVSALAFKCVNDSNGAVIKRLEEIYSCSR